MATAARLNCLALFQLSLTRNLIQGANLDHIKDLKVSQWFFFWRMLCFLARISNYKKKKRLLLICFKYKVEKWGVWYILIYQTLTLSPHHRHSVQWLFMACNDCSDPDQTSSSRSQARLLDADNLMLINKHSCSTVRTGVKSWEAFCNDCSILESISAIYNFFNSVTWWLESEGPPTN